jgi:D-sedoheptulose 7-phosphate isomerase
MMPRGHASHAGEAENLEMAADDSSGTGKGAGTERVRAICREHCAVVERFSANSAGVVEAAATTLVGALRAGGKLLLFGNGGSAADAQHLAAEFVNRFAIERQALPAIALTTDSSVLTSIGNDYEFPRIFARQVEALGRRGDVAIGLSTSGRSANVLAGLRTARHGGLATIGFTGESAEGMAGLCDHLLLVPSRDTPRIQEVHILAGHILCQLVDAAFAPKDEVPPESR